MNEPLLDAIEHAARLARLERRQHRQRDLRREIAEFLAANPSASANDVRTAVRGRKTEVLAIVRDLRNPEKAVPVGSEPQDRRSA